MTAALTPAFKPMPESDPAPGLAPAPSVIVVDPDRAEIVAADTAGSRALGLFAYAAFPIALEQSTPALARLREIAALGNGDGKAVEKLTFWSNGRLKPLHCIVNRQAIGPSGIFVLHLIEAAAPDAQVVIDETGPGPQSPSLRQALASGLDPDHLAKLAHELKTPLTAIAAAAEVMRDERLGIMGNTRYLDYAADIHENATHALDVIASLLSESGISGTPPPRLIALDLNAIVERTVSSVQALAQSRNLSLTFTAESSRPHIVANPTSLRQVLLNLLTNAIKFTPPGGDVRVETGHRPDGRVFLAVRDTGCGINNGDTDAPAIAPQNETSQPWLNGSGIGLPLVQRLVNEMHAEFEIERADGKGTLARISFARFSQWPA
jgi:signal transduction histidine kinase